jgi:prophage regulatory protein
MEPVENASGNMINLRPAQAAKYLGIGISTFWDYAKGDPTFPRLFKISPRVTLVRKADLDAWMFAKRAA